MAGQMDEGYFDEKRQFALDALQGAAGDASAAAVLIQTMRYGMPDLTSPGRVHEFLKSAASKANAARRDYEKARWAAANTGTEFEDWLRQHGHLDLVIS